MVSSEDEAVIFRRSVSDARGQQPTEGEQPTDVDAPDEQATAAVPPVGEDDASAEVTTEQEPGAAAEPAADEVTPGEPADEEPVAADEPDPEPVTGATQVVPGVGSSSEGDETAVVAPGSDDDEPVLEDGTTAADARPRRRRRRTGVLLGVGLALVVLGGGYALAASYLGDRVPQGTTVAGVDVSGLTSEEARATLEDRLGDVVTAPIPVEVDDVSTDIDPGVAGLALDLDGTVEPLTGFTLDPRIVLGHLFGRGEVDPVVTVDEDALTEAVAGAATEMDRPPVDGAIEISGADAEVVTEPEDGVAVDVDASAELLATGWLTASRPFELPSETVTPQIDDAAVATAMSDVVEPLLSGPVTVQAGDDSTELSPEQLGDASTLVAGDGELALQVDGEALAAVIAEVLPSVGQTPQDAQIVLQDGEPTIVPAVTGTGLAPEQLADVVGTAALAEGDERVATAELSESEPEFSTADAEELGVTEVVSTFSTPMPYDPPRTENLVVGTSHISGTLIKPDETFSLLEALGPITPANGFNASGVVVDGFATEALGGGLSQLSTTTFNAAFEAGMDDVFHQAHSRWFSRYPEGREATMFAPDLDMRWRNNTPYGVLVQAWVADGRTYVQLWSNSYWDVDISTGGRYNQTSPQTVYNTDPDCRPESGGQSGFTVDVSRTVARDGAVNDTFSRGYTTTYQPWNKVVCGERPSPDDEPGDDESGDSGGDGGGDSGD